MGIGILFWSCIRPLRIFAMPWYSWNDLHDLLHIVSAFIAEVWSFLLNVLCMLFDIGKYFSMNLMHDLSFPYKVFLRIQFSFYIFCRVFQHHFWLSWNDFTWRILGDSTKDRFLYLFDFCKWVGVTDNVGVKIGYFPVS